MTDEQWDHLLALLREMRLAVIAFSGGVDSALLLSAAAEALGPNLLAVTADSESFPPQELAAARAFTAQLGVRHRVLTTAELFNESFSRNAPDRCYHCKQELFGKLRAIADQEGIPWVLDGSNKDDLGDHRPGRRAARELCVRSPLIEAGLTKADVREHAKRRGLAVWDKPSLACLASRIPYGTVITAGLLRMVGSAEDALRAAGFRQVRVRHHGDMARIEVERGELGRMLDPAVREGITARLKELGYRYVCLDLEGYRTGSMNEGLGQMREREECGMRNEKRMKEEART